MTTHGAYRVLFVLGLLVAALVAVGLQGVAISEQSLVGDAPYHLLAGHQALRYGENRLNLEHPPLVKLVAALPLLREAPLAPQITIDQALEASLRLFDDPERMGRTRIAARLLVAGLFGVPFVLACFLLGREAGGVRTGAVLALLVALSIPILPNLSIIQTDAAVSLGFALSAAAALRFLSRPSAGRAAALGLGVGMAMAAKFSGLLVVPTAVAAVGLAGGLAWRRRLGYLGVIAGVSLGAVYTTYAVANRSYEPAAGRDTISRYCRNQALIVDDEMRRYETALLRVEELDPNLAQWLTGLVGIRIQNAIGVYPSYAFGQLSSTGRWWYFPAVLLIKTPLALIAATIAAVATALASARLRRRRAPWRPLAVMGLTAAVYLGTAIGSNYNLGVRHLMPVLPLAFLPAARWAAERRWRSAALVGALTFEALALTPLWMSATNTWWLGRFNPTRFVLSAGNTEYRQNFIALADAAADRRIETLHVLYPLVSPQEIAAYLPRAVLTEPGDRLEPGQWYAVNVTLEQYIPAILRASPGRVRGHAHLLKLAKAWQPLMEEVARGEDHGYVAATFHLYRSSGVDRKPSAVRSDPRTSASAS